jgi:hypothetical protein
MSYQYHVGGKYKNRGEGEKGKDEGRKRKDKRNMESKMVKKYMLKRRK